MAIQLRETQLGSVLRLLSGRRLLQYPDELDPSLAETFRRDIDGKTESEAQVKGSPENNKHIYLVGWYGPDDPENPQNWSSTWKLFIAFQICLLNFSVYVASSIYVPGEESLMHEFHVGEVVATLGLSAYSLGYGIDMQAIGLKSSLVPLPAMICTDFYCISLPFHTEAGPMLWSPMSEIPTLGRRDIYIYTLLAFVLLQLPTGFAVNMAMFAIFRLFCGFTGSPALATGGATLSDCYPPESTAYGICIWGSFGLLGPVAGPLIGSFIATAKDWRWTIWFVAWLNAPILILLVLLMPETSAATILYKRAQRLRASSGDQRFRSQAELDAQEHTWRDHVRVLSRACTLTFTEPIVFALDLYTALLYGVLFTWFESFPLVFGELYGFSIQQQGLVFLGIFVGAIVTVPAYLLWIRWGIVPRIKQPNFAPETVLPPTFIGSFALPICLFWYGWAAREGVHWMVPTVGSGLFTVAIVTLFNPVLNYLGIAYPDYAASVFAGNALFRASFGAIFPLFARQLFRNLGVGPGNSLLGGISILFIPIPFLFHKYGVRIRHMSKHARHDV